MRNRDFLVASVLAEGLTKQLLSISKAAKSVKCINCS